MADAEIAVLTAQYQSSRESNKWTGSDLTVPEFAIYEEEVNITAATVAGRAGKHRCPNDIELWFLG
jgi:hypothetical protein